MKKIIVFATFLLGFYACSSNDCVTCTIGGLGETVCEEDLDVYNVLNGTNFNSLDQYRGTIEGLGGSCN